MTDKELTVEVVKSYLSGYYSRPNVQIINGATLQALISDVYDAISKLEPKKEQKVTY